ncbi:hypothetical protein JCM11641_001607 [Rhodosporidiobolus odoratus]
MPTPQPSYISTTKDGYDPATLSDEEDAGSDVSRSTWASTSDATILGLVDGLIEKEDEARDWKISRVGGVPSFPLSRAPAESAASCLSCSKPMPLLSQLYVPLQDSALERVVYVFACPRHACRKRPGAVRAYRANALWVEGATEEQRKEEEARKKEEEKQQRALKAQQLDLGGMIFGGGNKSTTSSPGNSASTNPFAPPPAAGNPFAPSAANSNPFAPTHSPASNPFATSPALPPAAPSSAAPTVPESAPIASTSTSTWPTSLPHYPPQYINTIYESSFQSSSSTPNSLAKHLASQTLADDDSDESDLSDEEEPSTHRREGKGAGGRTKKGAKGGEGRKDGSGTTKGSKTNGTMTGKEREAYEVQKVKGVDEVFLAFQERVGMEGRQVVRYDHSSTPLPFSASSQAYRTLFPPFSTSHLLSTASSSTPASQVDAQIGTYTPSRAPSCKHCGAGSVFEYQLMPNLVSALNATRLVHADAAEEEVKEKAKEKAQEEEEQGLEFATVWVFGCERECCGGEGEAWREEGVLVEWEEE